MATYVVGSGGDYATWAAVSWSSGNVYDGQGEVFTEQITIGAANVTVQNVVLDGANAVNYGIKVLGYGGITIQDFETRNHLKNGILIENDTGASTITDIVIRRGVVHGVEPGGLSSGTEANIRIGSGIVVGSGPTTGTAVINRLRIEDVIVHSCGRHGIDVRWRVLNVTRKRCTVYNTGTQTGGHGITSHPIAITITSEWALESGTVYSRSRTSVNDIEQFLANTTDGIVLTKVSGSPGDGEWSVDATKVYINIGAAPTGKTFMLKRHAHGPFVDIGHVIYGTVAYGGTEGHGLDYDDTSGPAHVTGVDSHDNGGAGIYLLNSERISLEGNKVCGNASAGINALCTDAVNINNNTASENAARGIQTTGGRNGVIYNNVSVDNDANLVAGNYGGIYITGNSGLQSGTNIVYGNSQGISQAAGVTSTTANPLLDDALMPQAGSPCILAGSQINKGATDFHGRRFRSGTPTIGAIEVRPRIVLGCKLA